MMLFEFKDTSTLLRAWAFNSSLWVSSESYSGVKSGKCQKVSYSSPVCWNMGLGLMGFGTWTVTLTCRRSKSIYTSHNPASDSSPPISGIPHCWSLSDGLIFTPPCIYCGARIQRPCNGCDLNTWDFIFLFLLVEKIISTSLECGWDDVLFIIMISCITSYAFSLLRLHGASWSHWVLQAYYCLFPPWYIQKWP